MNFHPLSQQVAGATWVSHPNIELPAPLSHWMTDTGSLTAKLQHHTSAFNVQVLHHGAGALSDSERSLMGVDNEISTPINVREVLLCHGQTPWVFARSLIPLVDTLDAYHGIGDQPLGELLFNDPATDIGPFQFASFSPLLEKPPNNPQIPPAKPLSEASLWGRRRAFSVTNAKVIVAEVFLPQAPCYGESIRSEV